MRRKTLLILTATITFSLSTFVGCGNQQKINKSITEQPAPTEKTTSTEVPTPTNTPVPTEAPTQTNTPVPTEAPTPTNTPVPTEAPTPTNTPVPTETPTPTPTEPPHEHAYNESITKESTCTKAGEKCFICECGDTYTEVIEAIGHNYQVVANSAVSATCTKDGKEADTKCSLCGEVVNGAIIPKISHSYGKYVYNNDATTEKDGTETASCGSCGNKDTRTKADTKIEICPYELYVMKYDNLGLPYFYGKWGGDANMDAENLEKTDACMSQMKEDIKVLATRNYEYTDKENGFIHTGSISPGTDISWSFIGTYQGEKIVVRYVHALFYYSMGGWYNNFEGYDPTEIRWESNPIVIDKSLEERGIETAGNGVW